MISTSIFYHERMVGSEGFEPPQRDPKSLVLPLDEPPIKIVGDVRIELTLRASETPVFPLYESPVTKRLYQFRKLTRIYSER